jgi:CheY-like chemotaxis protein
MCTVSRRRACRKELEPERTAIPDPDAALPRREHGASTRGNHRCSTQRAALKPAIRAKPSRAAQFAVASELCKRGYEVAFTQGNNTPLADLMVISPETHSQFLIDVKGLYIFVLVPRGVPNQFFIMTQDAVNASRWAGGRPDNTLAGRSVVLVDDDADVRQVTTTMLTHLGCRVTATHSGAKALAALDEGSNVDIAVIDFAMPGMNGIEVAEGFLARRPNLPIVIVTGYADVRLHKRAEFRLLKKPFSRDDLAAVLIAALQLPDGDNIVPLRTAGVRRFEADGSTFA